MKRLFLICCLFLPGLVPAQELDPSDEFLNAYLLIQKSDSAARNAEWLAAYRGFEAALLRLRQIHAEHPDWNPNVVKFRIGYCQEQLADLKPRIPPEELAPPPPPPPPAPPPPAKAPPGAVTPADLQAQQRIEDLTTQLAAAQQEIQKLETGQADLQARLADALERVTPAETNLRIEQILEQNQKLSTSLAEAQQRIQNLAGQADNLQQARDRIEQLENDQAELTARLAAAEAQAGRVKGALDTSDARIAELVKENELLTAEVATARAEMARLREEGSPEQAAEIARLREQLAEAVAEMERSQQELGLATADLAVVRGELDGARAQNLALQVQLKEAEGAIATLEMAKQTDDEVILYLRKENALLKEITQRRVAAAGDTDAEPETSASLWSRLFGPTDSPSSPAADAAEPPRMTASESDKLVAELTATKLPEAAAPEPRPDVPEMFLSRSASIRALLQQAQAAQQAGQDDQAGVLYRRVLESEPDNLLALSNLGVIRFRQGDLKEAETNTRRAVALAPNDSQARALLGIIYFRSGKPEEAFRQLTRAIALDPRHAQAHNFLGITLSAKGWDAAAEQEIRKAIELDPQYADAHFNLAVLYAAAQSPRYERARYHYQKAVDLGAAKDNDLEQLLAQAE